ncbi:stress responsive alpha/beta barrel protein [Pseudacidovorax intermedius]|uniref:Stress responsive alpha/beta barrel protein n=1 Tax=Pseudacidovorax intermedius TaxID=433924 RepID=A0A370FGL5_9BURK|nr:Dabb family protein [Pseudacidovorax intermedius]RDI24190.1 stress responsive alpha/beta barrel protein [Pseudacidovorax intermedius]
MFIHAVLMAFKPGTDEAFHQRVEDYAAQIRAGSPGLVSYLYAPNEASRAQGFSHAVVACFADEAAHERYQISAVHQEMKAFMAGQTERLVVFDSGHWR